VLDVLSTPILIIENRTGMTDCKYGTVDITIGYYTIGLLYLIAGLGMEIG
jgi:hypothetical protein